jgi:hypothetical protein
VSLWLDDATGDWMEVPAPVSAVSGVASEGRYVVVGPPTASPELDPSAAWEVVAFEPATRSGREWEQVAETRRGAEGIVMIETVGYPPVTAVADGRLLLGGQGALTARDPAARTFAHLADPLIRTFGGSAAWTGSHLVSLSNQASEGWCSRRADALSRPRRRPPHPAPRPGRGPATARTPPRRARAPVHEPTSETSAPSPAPVTALA